MRQLDQSTAGPAAIGRTLEESQVRGFLRMGSAPGALIIEGEHGIGKSMLWGQALTAAAQLEMTVLSVRPAQSEARMSFAGLTDLLDPVADRVLPRLNAPQRLVLEVALLRRSPSAIPGSEREIGAAVLAALRILAAQCAVLLAVDDVQWLDRASAEVLAYALRRIRSEDLRTVLTVRSGRPGDLTSVAEDPTSVTPDPTHSVIDAISGLRPAVIMLGPLPSAAMTDIIRHHLGRGCSLETERALIDASQGNPYWASELTRAFARSAGSPRAPLPMPASLSKLLTRRLATQPEGARAALLVVAALSRPTWAGTHRALAGRFADPDAAIDAAVAASLITESAGRLRPAHPLLGSAALQMLSPGRRQQLHRNLATLTADPEQCARHLALATDGEPDAAIARSLETGARSAQARGAPHTAAELADLAVNLTPGTDRAELTRRRLFAAELHFASGNLVRACELAEDVARDTRRNTPWAVLLPMLIESTYWVRGQRAAQAVLREVLDTPGLDLRSRAVALACAADVGDGLGSARSALAGESIAVFDSLGDTDPGALSMALVYLAEDHLDAGGGMARDLLIRAEAAEARQQLAHPRATQVLNRVRSIRAYQLKLVDDLDGARTELLSALALARSEGDDGSLPALLGHLALTECWAGQYRAGLAAVDEGLAHAAETGGVAPATLYAAGGLLAVLTGDAVRARTLIGGQLPSSPELVTTKKTIVYHHVLGLAALLDNDSPTALHHLQTAWTAARTLGIHEPGRRQRLEADLGQVLVAAGRLEPAGALAAEQLALGRKLDRPTLIGVGHRLDGLVHAARGELDDAVAALEAAVDAHRYSPLALELPRSLLALGQTQRRLKAKPLARTNLQSAVDRFTVLGAVPWAHIAQRELIRLDGPRTGSALTATEERVSSLAGAGRNNREIAAELFISTRTVEGHLATVYRKLGIRGRANLPRPTGQPART